MKNLFDNIIIKLGTILIALAAFVVSIFALCQSYDANQISKDVFDWQKKQEKLKKSTKIKVLANWSLNNFILDEIKKNVEMGINKVTLLGQNVNDYVYIGKSGVF